MQFSPSEAAKVAVGRVLDSGGLKSMKAAGRLCEIDDDGLRDMMRALHKQIWSREWKLVIDPRLSIHGIPQQAQSFLMINATAADEGGIVTFADSKSCTKYDAERVQPLLVLHFSCLGSQVWRHRGVQTWQTRR